MQRLYLHSLNYLNFQFVKDFKLYDLSEVFVESVQRSYKIF